METMAPAALAALIPQLTRLTAGQPTTAEIVEAQKDAEARQTVEAERINAAHPTTFNISDFAAKSLGMSRGA